MGAHKPWNRHDNHTSSTHPNLHTLSAHHREHLTQWTIPAVEWPASYSNKKVSRPEWEHTNHGTDTTTAQAQLTPTYTHYQLITENTSPNGQYQPSNGQLHILIRKCPDLNGSTQTITDMTTTQAQLTPTYTHYQLITENTSPNGQYQPSNGQLHILIRKCPDLNGSTQTMEQTRQPHKLNSPQPTHTISSSQRTPHPMDNTSRRMASFIF